MRCETDARAGIRPNRRPKTAVSRKANEQANERSPSGEGGGGRETAEAEQNDKAILQTTHKRRTTTERRALTRALAATRQRHGNDNGYSVGAGKLGGLEETREHGRRDGPATARSE